MLNRGIGSKIGSFEYLDSTGEASIDARSWYSFWVADGLSMIGKDLDIHNAILILLVQRTKQVRNSILTPPPLADQLPGNSVDDRPHGGRFECRNKRR